MPSLKIRGRQAATTLEPATAGAPVPHGSATRRSASSPSATSSDATPAA